VSASPPDSTVHVDEDEVLPAFAAVFGEHRHDCVTFEVTSGRGEFSARFQTRFDTPVWDIGDEPPRTRIMGYEEVDRALGIVVLQSDASTPAEALVELRDIVGQIGGKNARVQLDETRRMAKLTPREAVGDLIDTVRALVNRGGRA